MKYAPGATAVESREAESLIVSRLEKRGEGEKEEKRKGREGREEVGPSIKSRGGPGQPTPPLPSAIISQSSPVRVDWRRAKVRPPNQPQPQQPQCSCREEREGGVDRPSPLSAIWPPLLFPPESRTPDPTRQAINRWPSMITITNWKCFPNISIPSANPINCI
jgi:hypothetical protein